MDAFRCTGPFQAKQRKLSMNELMLSRVLCTMICTTLVGGASIQISGLHLEHPDCFDVVL